MKKHVWQLWTDMRWEKGKIISGKPRYVCFVCCAPRTRPVMPCPGLTPAGKKHQYEMAKSAAGGRPFRMKYNTGDGFHP